MSDPAATPAPASALAGLLHPVAVEEFLARYWEKEALLVPGDPGRFAHLFSSADLGRLLHYTRPRPPEGMLLVRGSRHCDLRWTDADGGPNLDKVREAWRQGYTVVVNQMGKLWEPVTRFAAALEGDLHHSIDVNLYLTPPGSQAFDAHFDVMDAFIVQLEGSKVWEVRGPAADLPFPDEHRPLPQDDLPPVVFEEELSAGGVLYLPRGHVHAARTAGGPSLHLTLGVNVVTWLDLFTSAVTEARRDPRMRRGLPPGYLDGRQDLEGTFRELLADLPGHLGLGSALGWIAETLFSRRPPPREDLVADDPTVEVDTVLTHRPGTLCRALEGPGYAGVQYSGGKIVGPAKIGPALRHVAATDRFTVGSLPGPLQDAEKLVLARRLVRDGLLVVEATSEGAPRPG